MKTSLWSLVFGRVGYAEDSTNRSAYAWETLLMSCYRVCIDWIRNSNLCKEASLPEGTCQHLSQNSHERNLSWVLMLIRADRAVSEPVRTVWDPQCAHGWNIHNCGRTHLHQSRAKLARADWLSLLWSGPIWPKGLLSRVGSANQKTLFMPISPPDEVYPSHAQLRNHSSKTLASFGPFQNALCFK